MDDLSIEFLRVGGRFPYRLPYESLADAYRRLAWLKAQQVARPKSQPPPPKPPPPPAICEIDPADVIDFAGADHAEPMAPHEVRARVLELVFDGDDTPTVRKLLVRP